MNKLMIQDLDLKGTRVFVRVDFNVPIKDSKVTDDLRIREALPTIRYGIEHGAILVLASHLGPSQGQAQTGILSGSRRRAAVGAFGQEGDICLRLHRPGG